MIEYEFTLFVDGGWVAGGSSSSLEETIAEAHHYRSVYSADGETELKYYERREITEGNHSVSERILQVVEEVKEASREVSRAAEAYKEAEANLQVTGKTYSLAKEVLKQAERRLTGVIYEETQG